VVIKETINHLCYIIKLIVQLNLHSNKNSVFSDYTLNQLRLITADFSAASSISWHMTPSLKSGLNGTSSTIERTNSATSITNESA